MNEHHLQHLDIFKMKLQMKVKPIYDLTYGTHNQVVASQGLAPNYWSFHHPSLLAFRSTIEQATN